MRLSAGVAIAVAALFLTGVGGAADFTDPVGDTYGPDIDKVTIAERPGFLDVTVHVADHPELAEDEIVEVDIDTDANDQTGDGGIDVYGVVQGQEDANRQNFIVSEVLKYDKAVDDYVDTDAAKIDFDNGTATLAVPLSLVGAHTVRIAVSAIAAPLPEPPDPNNPPPPPTKPDTDYAPNTGVYTFTLATPTLRRAAVTYQPAAPRAGQLFKVQRVSVTLSSGGPFSATPACTATLAGKKLAATSACTWRLPKNAKGKSLRVSVAATYAGTTFRLPARTFRVR
jgi:hypothetical protein